MKNFILIMLCIISSHSFAGPEAPNKGNYNASSSCFLNAANQAFFHIRPFRDFLEIAKKENYYDPETTAGKFIEYMNLMAENKDRISPAEFRKSVAKTAITESIINMRHGQHDSQEYFSYILQILREQARDEYIKTVNDKLESLFLLTTKQTLKNPSIIDENSVTRVNLQENWIVQLHPNKNNNSLEYLIQNYFAEKQINKETTEKLSIEKLPEILVLHFVRFIFEEQFSFEENKVIKEFKTVKDESQITFPLQNLDFTQFLSKKSQQSAFYSLVAMVEHSGSLKFGHYWTYARWEDKWYKYDDMSLEKPVKFISKKTARSITEQKLEKGYPYLLIYARQKSFIAESKEDDDVNEESEEEEEESEWTSPKEITSEFLKQTLEKIPLVPSKDLNFQLNEIQNEQQRLEKMLETALSRLGKLEEKTDNPEEPKEIRNSLEIVQKLLMTLKQKLVVLTEEIMRLKLN